MSKISVVVPFKVKTIDELVNNKNSNTFAHKLQILKKSILLHKNKILFIKKAKSGPNAQS